MSELKIAGTDVFQIDLPYSDGVYRLSGSHEYRTFATILLITKQTGLKG